VLYRELALPWAGRSLSASRLLAEEAHAVFVEWQAKPDRIEY